MERMKTIPDSPMDLLLLPVNVHRRISRRLPGVMLAALFVGAFDLAFQIDWGNVNIFGGSMTSILSRFLVLVLMSPIIGVLDVFIVIWPVADFARLLASRREKYISSGIHAILMKVYGISHLFLLLPYAYLTFSGIDTHLPSMSWNLSMKIGVSIALALSVLLPFLQLAMLFRTLSVRSKMEFFSRLMVIAVLYFWSELTLPVLMFAIGWVQKVLTLIV